MNPFLNTAFKAARKAGDMMIRAAKDLGSVRFDSKAFNDFVSDVDRMSETILTDALIAQEAGAIVTDTEGEQGWLQSGNIAAANPKVLAQLLPIIAAHTKAV